MVLPTMTKWGKLSMMGQIKYDGEYQYRTERKTDDFETESQPIIPHCPAAFELASLGACHREMGPPDRFMTSIAAPEVTDKCSVSVSCCTRVNWTHPTSSQAF